MKSDWRNLSTIDIGMLVCYSGGNHFILNGFENLSQNNWNEFE